jgi:hypothetical protein
MKRILFIAAFDFVVVLFHAAPMSAQGPLRNLARRDDLRSRPYISLRQITPFAIWHGPFMAIESSFGFAL